MKRKTVKDFGKFMSIGFLWSGINVIFMWLLVDIIGLSGFVSSTSSIIFILIGRYYSYVFIGLIHRQFIKFASTNILFTLSNIALMTITIDVIGMNTVIASVLVVGGLFALKFLVFKKINLIKG